MKKILIISYYFPPLGMGGVQRAAKFAKYLPELGHDTHVLTVKPVRYYHYDHSLLEGLDVAKIHRAGSLDPLRLASMFGKINTRPTGKLLSRKPKLYSFTNRLFTTDSKVLWAPFARRKASGIIRKYNIDTIITTSPPHSVHGTGLYLKKKFNVTWVADFRDYWDGRLRNGKITIGYDKSVKLLSAVLQTADAVTAVSEGICTQIGEYCGGRIKPVLIPNGVDTTDLPEFDSCIKTDNKLVFGYMGTWNAVLDPRPFISALGAAAAKRKEIFADCRVKIIGENFFGDDELFKDHSGLKQCFEFTGYLNHKQALAEFAKCDIQIFLLSEQAPEGMVTGKVFEYLAFKKPLFAIVPDCEASYLIEQWADCRVVHPRNMDLIQKEVEEYYQRWQRKEFADKSLQFNEEFITLFSRKVQTEKLAGVIDEIE